MQVVISTLKVRRCYCELWRYRMSVLPILCIAAALCTIGCASLWLYLVLICIPSYFAAIFIHFYINISIILITLLCAN
jgi:hypothetical protein